MTFPTNPGERSPKGDHNRRLALGLDPNDFARAAGVSVEELREYEETPPDGRFSEHIAQRVGEALETLENAMAIEDIAVVNGGIPRE